MKLLSLLAVAFMAVSSTVDGAGVFVQPKVGTPIPGKYIVMLKQGTAAIDSFETKFNEMSRRNRVPNAPGGGRRRKFAKIAERLEELNGFTIVDGEDDLQELLSLDEVNYIEQDATLKVIPDVIADAKPAPRNGTWENLPNWGLLRISQRKRVKDECVNQRCATYKYPKKAGAGITAYVIDTGIQTSHPEFEGRAYLGKNVIEGSPDTDEHGHGTYVASILGGRLAGVAKKVSLVDVKVLNKTGYGTISGIVAGMDWVGRHARGGSSNKRAVVNMSLIAYQSRALHDAVGALTNASIPVIAGAGNDPTMNPCESSPAGAPSAFAVAASNVGDSIADFSSVGKCVDIIAPGVDVYGASFNPSKLFQSASGTSVASPMVAGVAAVYMSMDRNLRTTTQIYNKLKQTATRGKISAPLFDTPNVMVYLS
ncbi:hypothetical protein DFQ26_001387 [Actinomortierella ambigua]|nr:hypothetical protein DFQ26_001387 [Actinomortierella ambigua]